MRFIIPAKAGSQRVHRKNWRPFHEGESLVDITIGKLIRAGVDREKIHLSCECEETAGPVAKDWKINYLPRDQSLCENSVPLTTWIRSITAQIPGNDDIAWCQVCDPLFDEHWQCLKKWTHVRDDYDSLVVCYPWRGYLMTGDSQPVGWSFGEHHTPSQQLSRFRTMPFTLSILTREAIAVTGYHVGKAPFWYESNRMHVDIDTEQDFRIAQVLHADISSSCYQPVI